MRGRLCKQQVKMSSVRKADSGETKGRARAGRDSLKGSFVGNYELLQTIGEGSFAKVKLAKHRITHQKACSSHLYISGCGDFGVSLDLGLSECLEAQIISL